MIKAPILENEFVRDYIKTCQTSVSIRPEADLPEVSVFSFDLDYHNFVILATLLGQAFQKNGMTDVIQDGISTFSETLRENVLTVAIRRFYQKMEEEGETGELCEMLFNCQTHLITLHDLLKLSFKRATNRISFHGGKPALKVFNDFITDIAQDCFINIQVNVGTSTWSMFSHHGNSRALFFEAETAESLFTKLLTPTMRTFYASMKI